jgi:hypothetical protein
MAEALGSCPYCKKEFADKRERYTHLGRWNRCPLLAEDITLVAAPSCACGCGQRVEASKRDPGRYNKYVKGHNKRGKEN